MTETEIDRACGIDPRHQAMVDLLRQCRDLSRENFKLKGLLQQARDLHKDVLKYEADLKFMLPYIALREDIVARIDLALEGKR